MRKLFMLGVIASVLAGCQHGDKPCQYYQDKLESPIYFRFDSADMTPKAKVTIDEGIEYLRKHRFSRIKIDAYADPMGAADYNMDLTHRRAMAIHDYIISQGIAEKRVQINWHGSAEADNKNYPEQRRVNISVL